MRGGARGGCLKEDMTPCQLFWSESSGDSAQTMQQVSRLGRLGHEQYSKALHWDYQGLHDEGKAFMMG